MSEQQFAASLEVTAERPQFEIDQAVLEDVRVLPGTASQTACLRTLAVADVAEATQATVRTSDGAPVADSAVAANNIFQPVEPESDWRSMVSAKVSSYKARKPHKERYPSLKLQFDPPPQRASRPAETLSAVEEVRPPVAEPRLEYVSEPDFVAPLPAPLPPAPARIVMEATARVIEFPRPVVRVDELAEPVIDRPRIVEAPELLPPPPAMGGIIIEERREPEPEHRPGFDVPLQSASLNRRVAAGVFDLILVVVAVALFEYVFIRMNGGMPPLRSAAVLAASLAAVFWPAYQYAFLVFSGKTPGLYVTKLHLARFDGHPVSRNLRRWRVLASVLSLSSLGLGYAWCYLDEDQLSWHDRITRTQLAPCASGGAKEESLHKP